MRCRSFFALDDRIIVHLELGKYGGVSTEEWT